jgi:ribonuclease G
MSKEMIISVNGREKKIAIVEDDVVTEFYVERGDENQGIVGNIYKGRVMKVLPGMQSAFVDIGLERDSFLYVSDFFDEEEEEEEIEEKREAPRQAPKPPRPQRENLRIAVPVEPELDEEKEFDPRVAALSHIEEISEEPVLEPAPDDEKLETGTAEMAEEADSDVSMSPRQRRQRRLRYSDRAPKQEEAPAAAKVQEPETPVTIESEVSESEEEYSGRRRRRPRRRRGSDAVEAGEASEALRAEEVEAPPAYILVHHEPMERIIDDDMAAADGEMLKDALLQERIEERIHAEERRTSLLEVEPTPEVLVGSLHRSITTVAGFERVSDDSESREEIKVTGGELTAEWAPSGYEPSSAAEATSFEQSEESESGLTPEDLSQGGKRHFEPEGDIESQIPESHNLAAGEHGHWEEKREETDETGNEDSAESTLEANAYAQGEHNEGETETVEPLPPLEEASAEIRQRPRKGEMATRRGGRGRRRAPYRPRATATTEPSVGVEDRHEVEEQFEQAPPTPAPFVRSSDRFTRPVITDLLREGQEIIVQIAKEPIGQKGARITSHVALPGRYIVYMPTVEHIGVSRKIGTDEERQRLKRTLHQLRAELGVGGGFIVRTAANGCPLEELREDMQYLIRTWTDIRRRSDRVKAPAIAHRDLDLVQRILRDHLSSDFNALRVDNEFEYERIVDFVNRFAPKLVNRVKLYTKETPILENYGVQQEIDKAVKPRVWLRSGGYIVINQTEALVAIDVNTGKFVGKSNRLEDTIVKTNLEAAKEIVRQIRLRDLGGIIVLDFIDMEERKNRQKVMGALEQELRSDRSPSKILQFNDFGLVAITRKRVKQSLERTLCTPCSYCGGGGMVKSPQTVSYEILAEARRISKDVDHHNEVILRVNPDVAKALRGPERDVLAEIEAYLGGLVTIKSDPTVHQEQFDIALA